MDKDLALFLVVVVLFALGAGGFYMVMSWDLARTRRLMDEWAAENGYKVFRADLKVLSSGPFSQLLTMLTMQHVCRIQVVDGEGQERCGWARGGGLLSGLWKRKLEIRWEGAK
jgi:hypothetical protein